MANKLYEESDIQAIANAIRAKGQTGTMKVSQMAGKVAAISTKESITWHQCPTAVRNYLDQVTYDPSDYSTSRIAEFAPTTAVSSNTKPISETESGDGHRNEVPMVETPFASNTKAGTLEPLDRLRWINTTDIENFRDFGGWNCDGGKIKYGKLFRGSRLVAETDRDFLLDYLKLGAELDLRYDNDIALYPATLKDYVDYLHVDGNWYDLTSKEKWKAHIRFVFDCVRENKVLWFHCAGGLDRTSTLACVIEGILGMSQSDIDKDYELGCFYSGSGSDSTARRRNELDWTGMISAINGKNGSSFMMKCVNFVASLGFTANEINDFRSSMIDGTPSMVTPDITNYTITKNLTLTNIDNTASTIQVGKSYSAKITAQSGTNLKSASVTMGGSSVTADTYKTVHVGGLKDVPYHGEIYIPFVSGNIVINAVSESNARIPSEYQEVAYISAPDKRSDGHSTNDYAACINPNIKWSEFDKIEFYGLRDDYIAYTGTSGLMILATYLGQAERASPYVAINDSGLKISGVSGTLSANYTKSQMREAGFKNITLTLSAHSSSGQVEFGSWSDAGYCMRWQTKEQKWYLGTTLVRHLIPCYRKSDSAIGMYDIVGGSFYGNAGNGELGKGNDV